MRATDSPMRVKSGDILSFQTTYPECEPLPDFALMDMQWKLSQIVSLSAADADMNFLTLSMVMMIACLCLRLIVIVMKSRSGYRVLTLQMGFRITIWMIQMTSHNNKKVVALAARLYCGKDNPEVYTRMTMTSYAPELNRDYQLIWLSAKRHPPQVSQTPWKSPQRFA